MLLAMILNQQQSKRALRKCDNADAATPGAIDLPDGNEYAERVMVGRNRRTGKTTYSICAPWLLCNVFSV